MPLWSYLTLIVNGVILVAFLGFGAYTASEQNHFAAEQIRRDTRALSENIAAVTANDLLTQQYDNIEGMLLRLARISTVQEVLVADAEGRVIVQVQRDAGGNPHAIYAASAKAIDVQAPDSQDGAQFSHLTAIERGKRIGWVKTTSSLAGLREVREHIWRDTAIALLTTLVVTGILLVYALRRSVASLERAARFASELIHQRGAQIDERSAIREIHTLNEALNAVSKSLSRQYQAIQDSEARKGAILEASLDSLIAIDEAGRIVEFNPAAEATFGYRRDEAVGQVMGDIIIPPQHRAGHAGGMVRYLLKGDGPILRKRIETTAIRRDGTEFPVELSVVPFIGGGKKFFLGSLRDISERKTLEAEQERVTELLRQSLRDLERQKFALDEHAIVSITDTEGTIVYANDKFLAISQYSREEVIGSNHRIMKSGRHPDTLYREMWGTLRSGRVWHGEFSNRRRDGEIYWVASTIVPLLDDAGVPYQYIAIRTDITAQKQAELALAEARRRELETGNQIQRTLLFGHIPHEIGNVQIASHTEASQGIDGDFYEFFQLGPRQFDLVIGDVMGKGIPAALIGAAVKNQLGQVLTELLAAENNARRLPQPEAIINALHTRITRRLIELDSFVTLAYYRLDLDTGRLAFVDAGHTRAILSNGKSTRLLSGDNLPLGVMEDERYRQQDVAFQEGELLFLYSDGVTEAKDTNQEEYGLERLSAQVQALHGAGVPPTVLIQAVRAQLRGFEQQATLSDDRTCMALRLTGQPNESTNQHRLEMPLALAELGPLRKAIQDMAEPSGLGQEAIGAMTLAAFEAATNIVRHAGNVLQDAGLSAQVQAGKGRLEVCLDYVGPPFAPPEDYQPDFSGDKEGGFGLYIIQSSVDAVQYESPAPGVARIRLLKTENPS